MNLKTKLTNPTGFGTKNLDFRGTETLRSKNLGNPEFWASFFSVLRCGVFTVAVKNYQFCYLCLQFNLSWDRCFQTKLASFSFIFWGFSWITTSMCIHRWLPQSHCLLLNYLLCSRLKLEHHTPSIPLLQVIKKVFHSAPYTSSCVMNLMFCYLLHIWFQIQKAPLIPRLYSITLQKMLLSFSIWRIFSIGLFAILLSVCT